MHGGRFLPSVVLCISYEHPSDGIHRIVLSCFMNLHPSVVCRLFGEAKNLSGVDLSNVIAHLSAAYCFITARCTLVQSASRYKLGLRGQRDYYT